MKNHPPPLCFFGRAPRSPLPAAYHMRCCIASIALRSRKPGLTAARTQAGKPAGNHPPRVFIYILHLFFSPSCRKKERRNLLSPPPFSTCSLSRQDAQNDPANRKIYGFHRDLPSPLSTHPSACSPRAIGLEPDLFPSTARGGNRPNQPVVASYPCIR